MMRFTILPVLLIHFTVAAQDATPAPKQKPSVIEYPALRQRLQRGNYAEARAGYEALIAQGKPGPAAFIGLSTCLQAEGDYALALRALDDGLKQSPDHPDLLAHRADLNLFMGQWDDAMRDAEAALKHQESNWLARWVRVRILRDRGELDAANQEVRRIVKAYTDASNSGKEIHDAETLLIIGQAGTENARWNHKPQQFTFILNEIYKDAIKADADCWQAENLAGRLLAEKHNRADAAEAFDQALKINPRAVEALVGKGTMLLEGLDSHAAGQLAEQALKVNPHHPEALCLKADVKLAEGDFAEAARILLTVKLGINRRDERVLARLAAIAYLHRKPGEVETIVAEVKGFTTKPGVFYEQLAETLAIRKQYEKAVECYQKALEFRPELSSARAAIGLLFMQLGREAEARQQLEAAFQADPFHVRVSNALKVLKHLDGYALLETPHFAIRYDARIDKVQAPFVAEYLEQLHAEFSRIYRFAPPGQILVELFATREMFSGRVLSLPGLPGAAQGASTGPLIAIPSPRADGATARFNLGVVLRHELTHVFNLAQTGYLVPIWLTEGLAVRAEGTERLQSNMALYRERAAGGTLFDLDSINSGYHHFTIPTDVMLAYYQGYLYVEYITQTHGEDAIPRLLAAYRQGLDTSAALKEACQVEKLTFETGYRAFLVEKLKGSARAEKPLTLAELEAAHKKSPDDVETAAKLASEYLRRGKVDSAKKLLETARTKEPENVTATLVLVRLLQREMKSAEILAALEAAARAHPEDRRVLLALGRQYIERKRLEDAAKALESLYKLGNPENEVLELLVKIYAAIGNQEKLLPVLEELGKRSPDNLELWLKLARHHQEAGREAQAEKFAREALFVDVLNEEARRILLASLLAQHKDQQAEQLQSRFKP